MEEQRHLSEQSAVQLIERTEWEDRFPLRKPYMSPVHLSPNHPDWLVSLDNSSIAEAFAHTQALGVIVTSEVFGSALLMHSER